MYLNKKTQIIGFLTIIFSFFQSCNSEIKILGEDVHSTDALKACKQEFEAELESEIELTIIGNKYDLFVKKANQDLASKTGVYDIFLQYNTALSSYIRNDYTYTISDFSSKIPDEYNNIKDKLSKDIFPATWKEVGYYYADKGRRIEKEPYVFPFSANTMFLCYNKSFFENKTNKDKYKLKYNEELIPPETWKQFEQLAEFFTNDEAGTYGLSLQGESYYIYWEWCNFAFGMGGGVMKKEQGWQGDENTPLIIASPETIEATKLYFRLKQYDGSKDFFSSNAKTQINDLKSGKVAMAIVWSDMAYELENSQNNFDFGYVPIPGGKSMLAGGSFYINKNSKNPEEAMKLVLNLLSYENQKKLTEKGLCSPLRSVYEDSIIRQKISYASALKTSLDQGVYMLEAGPDSDAISVIISNSLQKIFREGDEDKIEEILKDTKKQIINKRMEIYEELKNLQGK
jgi:multiple sugar transport system substrate-binding protein